MASFLVATRVSLLHTIYVVILLAPQMFLTMNLRTALDTSIPNNIHKTAETAASHLDLLCVKEDDTRLSAKLCDQQDSFDSHTDKFQALV